MGSIISKINDDYEDYLYICEELNILPKEMCNMYNHEREILKEIGFSSKYDFFKSLIRSEEIDSKISDILK
jgi:hypothetical protein